MPQDLGRTAETSLRALARQVVLPEYPAGAVRAKVTGVVVADVYLDGSRAVSKVDILESPSAEISDAVRTAIHKWKFAPPDGPRPEMPLVGKLTFYFLEQQGRYRVFHPEDAPRMTSTSPRR